MSEKKEKQEAASTSAFPPQAVESSAPDARATIAPVISLPPRLNVRMEPSGRAP